MEAAASRWPSISFDVLEEFLEGEREYDCKVVTGKCSSKFLIGICSKVVMVAGAMENAGVSAATEGNAEGSDSSIERLQPGLGSDEPRSS